MINIKIKDKASEVITHEAFKDSQEEAQSWIDSIESASFNPWGLPQRQKDVDNCSQEELDSALEIIPEVSEVIDEVEVIIEPAKAVLPSSYEIEIIDLDSLPAPEPTQEEINNQHRAYLASTDWLVLRHVGQVALGVETSLTQQEYLQLEEDRQEARSSII